MRRKNFFFQKLSAISRDPLRAQILIHFSFNLCKNHSAYNQINTVGQKSPKIVISRQFAS